jgi:hypothetical protein
VGKAATTGRASAWHATAGVCSTTPARMVVVHEAKDECEKNKGEFSVHHDLQMKLSSFPVAPWRTSADDVFKTKITVVIVRQEVIFIH